MNTGNGARAFAFFTGLSFRYEFVHVPIWQIVFLCFVLVFFGCDRGAFGRDREWHVVCPSIFDIRYPIPFHSGGDPMKVTRATCIAAYR